jgi:outer membrane protein assembly factor BamB
VSVGPDGTRQWDYDTDPAGQTLAVGASGDIYFARWTETLDNCAELVSLTPSGQENWVLGRDAMGLGAVFSPAVLHDGTLAVPSCDESERRWLRAISPQGQVLWRTPLDSVDALNSVAVGSDTTIYVSGKDALAAVAPDGTIRWWMMNLRPGVLAVADDSTVLLPSDSLYAIAPDGRVRWTVAGSGGIVVVGIGEFYWARGKTLSAHDLADGSEIWSVATDDWVRLYPALSADGRLFTSTYLQAVAYSTATGAELWRHEFAGRMDGDPLITGSGLLLIGDASGYLEAFDIGAGHLESAWPMESASPRRTGRIRVP